MADEVSGLPVNLLPQPVGGVIRTFAVGSSAPALFLTTMFSAGRRTVTLEAAAAVAEQLGAEAVGMIGHVAIFFRPHPDPDERKVIPPQIRAARRAPSSRPR